MLRTKIQTDEDGERSQDGTETVGSDRKECQLEPVHMKKEENRLENE